MMPNFTVSTSTSDTPSHSDADNDGITTGPQLESLTRQLYRDEPSSGDDVSMTSIQHSDEDYNLEGLVEVSMDLPRNQETNAEDDSQGSVHSGKTNKTAATASTQSLSQSFAAACGEEEHLVEEGTSYEVEVPNLPQQHTGNGGYARLSSNFRSFEDDLTSPEEPGPIVVLGCDISHLSPKMQFMICASGVFGFSLLYGYLQELISVQILNRQLGLFLSMMQFSGYTVLSYLLRTYVNEQHEKKQQKRRDSNAKLSQVGTVLAVPFMTYLGLSLLRALDLAMTNLAMQYINYPAKTLMKSSRVVFTMVFGVFILRKKYLCMDYFIVLCMVAGLAIFMHADATSSAVFQPLGVIMLTISLLCDGAITNMSETIMTNYGVGQDEFIFRMYSIALVAVAAAAAFLGDLQSGMVWILQPGTYDEVQKGVPPEETSWSVTGKISVIILFSSMGLLSSSCSAAITKHFGALAMSITSTARKATTVFLSFFLFNNVCTFEHIAGVVIFIAALTAKSLRRRKDSGPSASSSPSNSSSSTTTTNTTKEDMLDVELLHRLRGELFPLRRPIERIPMRRQLRTPASPRGSFVDIESQHRLEPEKHHLTRPTERGTPINHSRMTVKAPSSTNGLDLPQHLDVEAGKLAPPRVRSGNFGGTIRRVNSKTGTPPRSTASVHHAGKSS